MGKLDSSTLSLANNSRSSAEIKKHNLDYLLARYPEWEKKQFDMNSATKIVL